MKTTNRDTNWGALVNGQKAMKATNDIEISKIDSYYFIFNCFENKIEYVNNTFEILTGYPKELFDINKLLDIIHPDDIDYFIACESRGLRFTNTLSFSEHFRYIMSYTYRIKTNNNQYVAIRQECQAIEVDSKGHLTKTFVTHRREKDFRNRDENDYYIFDKDKNQKLNATNFYNLTKREREIVDLVQDGLDSKQIGKKLHSSKHTIDTHRRNILKKTNSKNFIELLTKLNGFYITETD
ncbi:LuxR C-terminal-related transcriptional regulator [Sphingobacterium faecale]|uniref:PAS domain-containing protein n=1 Tax=Sphingobacterium faecale TaxID=2803775 RepID=A0ABS1R6V8_9SPHI|nr:LuxR C-terminal-related transcriptional regulator [Sphingobacterium faecale]MBL1410447.1 PAS domain-containing protein [Sphingobacterium faecale]